MRGCEGISKSAHYKSKVGTLAQELPNMERYTTSPGDAKSRLMGALLGTPNRRGMPHDIIAR